MIEQQEVADVLQQKLEEQPWYRTVANTVVTLVTLGVNIVWVLIGLGVDVPTEVLIGVAGAIQALGVIGVKFTPNGVTQRQIREIEQYVGKHRA
ncbi:membrane protein [Gordonia phage BillDoor]